MPSLISGSAAEMGDTAIKLASHQLSFYCVLSLSEDSQLQPLEEVTRQGSSVLRSKDLSMLALCCAYSPGLRLPFIL